MSPPDNPWDTGGELASHAGETGDTAWDTGLGDETLPDMTALVPPQGSVPWEATPEGFTALPAKFLEWFYGSTAAAGVPLAATGHALVCAKDLNIDDVIEILETLYNMTDDGARVEMSDPCQIRRMAKVGNCVARRYLGISFGPDLQDFWLDGKAATAGNLHQEVFQFPPDNRGSATSVSYYPMDTGWFFGRVGDKVESAVAEVQVISLWEGVRDRLRAPDGAVFPIEMGFSSKSDVSPLLTQAVVGKGPSTLHSTGVDWLYPEEFAVVFKHAVQEPNELNREFADEELFLAGGMTVTSEVEVRATPGSVIIDEEEFDGWTVTLESWRLRVSDRIDFHGTEDGKKEQLIPLGPVQIVLPDQLFVDLKSNGCPGKPTPVDFDVITDTWHELSPGVLKRQSLFVLAQPYQADTGNAFSGAATSFDFWDAESGQGVSLLDL